MKIIEGIKLKGRPAEIPDCGRRQLPEFLKEMGYRVGVEIGVQRGSFSVRLLRAGLEYRPVVELSRIPCLQGLPETPEQGLRGG
jgi:hypothetical protein